MKELDILFEELKRRGKRVISEKCKVTRYFIRRDGFKDWDTRDYIDLDMETFSNLTHRPWRIPMLKRMKLANDEAFPPYMDRNEVEFFPERFEFNKKKTELYIYYKEF